MECRRMGVVLHSSLARSCLDWIVLAYGRPLGAGGACMSWQWLWFQQVQCNQLKNGIRSIRCRYVGISWFYLPILTSWVIERPIIGTLGYRRRASLIQHSKYFMSFKFFIVAGVSLSSPKISSSSCTTRSWYSGWDPRRNKVHEIAADVVSWPCRYFVWGLVNVAFWQLHLSGTLILKKGSICWKSSLNI